jgi:glycosidase
MARDRLRHSAVSGLRDLPAARGRFYAPRSPPAEGTFLDVLAKVPYLATLGVTALQLMPIQEFPGNFSLGYNGTDTMRYFLRFTRELIALRWQRRRRIRRP